MVVRVSVTVPAVRSAALGVYTAFKVVLLGLYVPVPPLQVAPVAPFITPAKVIALALEQTVPLGPASTVGAGVKFTLTVSFTAVQLLLPVVVNTKFKIPLAISVTVGV